MTITISTVAATQDSATEYIYIYMYIYIYTANQTLVLLYFDCCAITLTKQQIQNAERVFMKHANYANKYVIYTRCWSHLSFCILL